jgi:hypothetical protein
VIRRVHKGVGGKDVAVTLWLIHISGRLGRYLRQRIIDAYRGLGINGKGKSSSISAEPVFAVGGDFFQVKLREALPCSTSFLLYIRGVAPDHVG